LEDRTIYSRDSIINILLYGFRNVWRSLLPLTILASPLLVFYILYGTVMLWHFPPGNTAKSPLFDILQNGYSLVIMVGFFYLGYVFLRYIHDVSLGQVEQKLSSYFVPNRSFLGVARIVVIGLFMGAYFGIATLIGLLFLILPGLIILFFGLTWFAMIFVAYLAEPEIGVMGAIKQNWRFTQGNFWRTVALGFFIGIAQCVIEAVVILAIIAVFVFAAFFVGQQDILAYAIIPSVAGAAFIWSVVTFGIGGTLFILNRYYLDLRARQQHMIPLVIPAQQSERR
jgi:hypothetical protein